MNNENKSTGPTSPEGKAISAKNALRHGCCADDTLILKSENPEDLKTLEHHWQEAYVPLCAAERNMVQDLVLAHWFHQRAVRAVTRIEAELEQKHESPLDWTEAEQRTLARFIRYQTARANLIKRAQKTLEDYRKNKQAKQMMEHKLIAGNLNLRQKTEAYEKSNEPEPSLEQMMRDMLERKRLEKERAQQR